MRKLVEIRPTLLQAILEITWLETDNAADDIAFAVAARLLFEVWIFGRKIPLPTLIFQPLHQGLTFEVDGENTAVDRCFQ